jgi:hypothetical protein
LARTLETRDAIRFFSSGETFWFCWATSILLNRWDDSFFKKGVIFIGVAISTNLIFSNKIFKPGCCQGLLATTFPLSSYIYTYCKEVITGLDKLIFINITENPALRLSRRAGFKLNTKLYYK